MYEFDIYILLEQDKICFKPLMGQHIIRENDD